MGNGVPKGDRCEL